MSTSERPPLEDDLDRDLNLVVEYLTLSYLADELNVIAPPLRRIVVALLAAEEAQGRPSPFRRDLLDPLRSAHGARVVIKRSAAAVPGGGGAVQRQRVAAAPLGLQQGRTAVLAPDADVGHDRLGAGALEGPPRDLGLACLDEDPRPLGERPVTNVKGAGHGHQLAHERDRPRAISAAESGDGPGDEGTDEDLRIADLARTRKEGGHERPGLLGSPAVGEDARLLGCHQAR